MRISCLEVSIVTECRRANCKLAVQCSAVLRLRQSTNFIGAIF